MRKLLLIVLVFLGCVTASAAQTLEVRNGDGAALQAALNNAPSGSTVLVYNGTYQTTNNGGDPSENGGFAPGHDGVVLKAAPGESPLLTNCPVNQSTYCVRPTITALGRQNFTVEGLRIHGGVWISGVNAAVGQGSRGIVLRGNDIDLGWGEVDDGNWSALFLQNITGALIVGNTFHDISVPSGGGQQSSGTCVKLYQNTDTIVENNTCRNVNIPASQSGGIDDKAQAVRNIHRFNWIESVNTCIRINNQLNSTGVQAYGNVCIAGANASSGRPGLRVIDNVDGATIYNNTFIGFPGGLWIMSEGGPIHNVRWYNNIVQGATTPNIEAYQAGLIAPTNYNAWTAGPRYLYGGAQNTFTQWKARGFDAAGLEVNCQASSTTGQLPAGSPCKGVGRVGGVATGAAVDLGAFGVTTCVGATCSTTPPPPTCTYTRTSAPTVSVIASGASVPITLDTGLTCTWAITASAPWLRLSSTSNTGPGQVTVFVDPNTGAERTGTVTTDNQITTFTQAAIVVTPPTGTSYTACVTILNNVITSIIQGVCP